MLNPLFLLAACGGVDHIEVPAEPVRVHDKGPILLDLRPLDAQNRRVPDVEVKVVESLAPDIVFVDPTNGTPRCEHYGEARLRVKAGRREAEVPILCALVDTVKIIPDPVELVFGEASLAEVPLRWELYDAQGGIIDADLPARTYTLDPDVARVEPPNRIKAVGKGQTPARVAVGPEIKEVSVVVGQVMGKADVGTGGLLTLPPGNVELRLLAAPEQRMKFRILGGSTCKDKKEIEGGGRIFCEQPAGPSLGRPTMDIPYKGSGEGRLIMIQWPNGYLPKVEGVPAMALPK